MHMKTAEASPQMPLKRVTYQPWRCEKSEKKEEVALTSYFPKMTFWRRLKYLFTGKVPGQEALEKASREHWKQMEEKAAKNLKEGAKALKQWEGETVVSPYAASYTSFAGCDIKVYLVDTPEEVTREAFLDNSRWAHRRPDESFTEHRNRCEKNGRKGYSFGELQAISIEVSVDPETFSVKSAGGLFCIMFDKCIITQLDKENKSLMLMAANEYGDRSVFILPNFKVTGWKWGIAVDDIVSEEHILFEADEPLYWDWQKNPAFERQWDKTGKLTPDIHA